MYYPAFERFKQLTNEGNLIPIYREILADTETPVSALMKLRAKPHCFLLESVEGGEKWGRYTFLGFDPHCIFIVRGADCMIQQNGETRTQKHKGDPLGLLKAILYGFRPVPIDGLPRFYGGAVGFLGYDMVRYFESIPARAQKDLQSDDATFLLTDTLMIFDNVRHTIKVVACALTEGRNDLQAVYDEAIARIEKMIELIKSPAETREPPQAARDDAPARSNMTPEAFKAMVKQAKDFIVAGDVIQVVLSQRFQREHRTDPIDLYRALRYINPSPYLFFLKLADLILIGSSPEVTVRLEEGIAELRPIAGTRKRGKNEQEDRHLSDELLQDPKERAEHVMLVDLGRNDLGRIARIGSVQVSQFMVVERYSHVMHLVSHVQAQLLPGKDAFDVLKATFPAGTLTGAPKIRAMEIIDEMEPSRRGPYGGAVGYFSYTGNMDFCITIRTMVIQDGSIYIQAGAGIVADSDPEAEYQETVNKAMGMMQAVDMAVSGLEIIDKNNR
ncbi:MAG: anthranilate synthase component I [Deltaproteobacteria bacterium RBG_16_54_11]|jgi:anthranilate synthase component 1|nr:MAG: anthranilate synthase component I [Deltaproteobacteria bacterium RBG_16_54_11]